MKRVLEGADRRDIADELVITVQRVGAICKRLGIPLNVSGHRGSTRRLAPCWVASRIAANLARDALERSQSPGAIEAEIMTAYYDHPKIRRVIDEEIAKDRRAKAVKVVGGRG